MIAFVRGLIVEVGADYVIVDVAGVGMHISCGSRTLSQLTEGSVGTVATSLVVREDSLTLFGFSDAGERRAFEILQTVNGVGPKLALAVLGTLSVDELRRAVATEDIPTLMRVPGVGRKGAQKLLIDLGDKLGAPAGPAPVRVVASEPGDWRSQVQAGLVSLGWTSREADDAVKAVESEAGDQPDVSALLRLALRSLAK